jgi:hypothetical protein
MNLRKTAKDQPCMVLVPGVCCGDPSTTVLAHYRQLGVSGIGMKSPDIFGAFACHACHVAIDAGSQNWTRDQLRLMHLQGVIRTQNWWLKEGYLTW